MVFVLLSLTGQDSPAVTGKPVVTHVAMAAPDVIAVSIRAQSVERGKQVPYERQPGDEIITWRQHRYVRRGDARIGALVGSEGRIIQMPDRLCGGPLDTALADQVSTYSVASGAEGPAARPKAVYRKSKPVNCTRAPAKETSAMEHTVFLKLSDPLTAGRRYTVHVRPGLLSVDELAFDLDPSRLRSEAVHVNQVGFRPDDPVKLAFLSCWMGSGGNLAYPACLSFGIVDDETGDVVFSGKTTLAKAAAAEGNRTKAEVHEMDFSEFTASGVYRVSVEGVGCSFPFEIGDDVWQKAFIKSMRGLYCQRSGVALGPPHTDFVRPRGFHPKDGVKVYVSEPHTPGEDETLRELPRELQTLIDSFEPGQGRFRQWMDDLTSQTLPNAWGGYMDAGDWDRRADHALMPLTLFDLAEMFPETFAQWKFNIPDSQDGLPDLINEALWEVDFLKRMQQDDGSVFGAIESGAHPRRGEASWQESLPVFAYARTAVVAYNYAAVASQAALWFQSNGHPQKAQEYRKSVVRAFDWAEQQPGEPTPDRPGQRVSRSGTREDARCLAAAELFRLTGDEQWHKIFLQTTRFQEAQAPFMTSHLGHVNDPQGMAAWTYLRTQHAGVDHGIQRNMRGALLRDADRDVRFTEQTEFHWTGGPGREIAWGALSKPESQTVVRAHFLTGDEKYLRAIVLSALSGAGANPVNMCYVTGVGTYWPQHPLHEDAYVTGQRLYEGVTIGGPIDPTNRRKHPNAARFEKMLYPPAAQWPATESYLDVFSYVPMNEFTVHQTMLPTSFVWGYLAARR
jgi:endoglucanase